MTTPTTDPADDSREDATELQIDEVNFSDIGQRIVELSEQLLAVGHLIDNAERNEAFQEALEHGSVPALDQLEQEANDAFRRTLTGLRTFRREYARWERIVVEYALTRQNYTQRDTAKLLGVGVSTINRWAQNPLKIHDYN